MFDNSRSLDSPKNNKRKQKRSFLCEVFSDYCSSTSIHGVGYLGATDKTFTEKIWWLIVFGISVAMCTYLIAKTWIKWSENPVIMTFSQERTPIWDIPFASVTICPLSKVKQNVYNYTHHYLTKDKLAGKDYKKFWDISLICNLEEDYALINKTTDEEAIENIKMVAAQLKDTIPYVVWLNTKYNRSSDLFAPQLTSEGICFTFNSLNQKDLYTDQINPNVEILDHEKENEGWSIEEGYPHDDDIRTYPERTAEDGFLSGMTIILHSMSYHKDFVCGNPVTGFKILLHNPTEAPRIHHQYILAPLKRQTIIGVKPKVVVTSKELLDIPPLTRNCYFSYEKKLRFFKFYSRNNCDVECLANVTRYKCDCLPFYMPRDNETAVCGYGSLPCLREVQNQILKYEILRNKKKMDTNEKKKEEYKIFKKCKCLSVCNSLDYSADSSQTDLHWIKGEVTAHFDNVTEQKLEVTQVDIFFEESHFIAMHRKELYGQIDFLANCGGLLGLFMGFSILSLLEIIYFGTLRIWCKLHNSQRSYGVTD